MQDNNHQVIRKPRVMRMPWRTSDGLGPAPVITRRIDEDVNVILATAHPDALLVEATHPDVVAAANAITGSRGICGCGDPVTKVQHPALGDRPTWIHDCNPEVQHPVANVRCVTRP